MKKSFWIAVLLLLFWPARAGAMEPLTDTKLDQTRATSGLALNLYGDQILDNQGLTPDQVRQIWQGMSAEEREAARQRFRQELMQMTPEERTEIRQQMLDQFLSLGLEEQQKIRMQMQENFQALSPDEKQEYMNFREHMLQPPDNMPSNGLPHGAPRDPLR